MSQKKCHGTLKAGLVVVSLLLIPATLIAQIGASSGSYTQNFNSLATSGSANAWVNNTTLPGWYVQKGSADAVDYAAGTGSIFTGNIYSFGVNGVNPASERALGSVASSSTTYTYGLRFTNDTANAVSNITVSYTGEQWRSGSGATSPQPLTFSYRVSSVPISNALSGAWTVFSSLTFQSPNLAGSNTALDGNASTNRTLFTNIALTGVTVAVGQELMIRWQDVDDSGFDNGLAIDDVVVSFGVALPPVAPAIVTQPTNQSVFENQSVTFNVVVTGTAPLTYQWKFNGTNIIAATNDSFNIASVTFADAGGYSVVVSNSVGTTNSQTATLTVQPQPVPVTSFTLLNYNTHGNAVADWTTNSLQVQAIGRQVAYLDPDIITFQEIPMTNHGWQHMGEFVSIYRPGFYLATNSGTDGFIRSCIISRYPITRSTSWLDEADLIPFGYSNSPSTFTRDLFEAEVLVPGFPQPLHVFTTHLKAGAGSSQDSARRAAEASAISNFFAKGFLTTNSLRPYLLTGDLNEDILIPSTGSQQPIQRLTNNTGLRLTTPLNPTNGDSRTFSIQAGGGLSRRYDYILPCALLFSNIAGSQVFRTDLLNPVPPNLNSNDDMIASDHLPLLMVFNNPYDEPFSVTSFSRSNSTVSLTWQSVPGQPYRVQASSNLVNWTLLSPSLVATGGVYSFNTNSGDAQRYFRVERVP